MTTSDSGQHFATRTRVEKKNLTFFREAGRGRALVQINNLVKFNPGLILLIGDEGSGRSRVLKQFLDSLKGKPVKTCVLDGAIKNETHLYTALADGFSVDFIPGENVKQIQEAVTSFLNAEVENNKPVIITLDNMHLCSLAMLEALIALRTKFKQVSLILVGDSSLPKMLERLQGGKSVAGSVVLNALDAREIRQYMNWRLPFQLSDIELANIVNISRGNIGLLEQEALKKEISHAQNNTASSDAGMFGSVNIRRAVIAILMVLVIVAGAVFAVQTRTINLPSFISDPLSVILGAQSPSVEVTAKINTPTIPEIVRSNSEWVDRQEALLMENKH